MADHQARYDDITTQALEQFRAKHSVRERAIQLSREVIRTSANAIRAVHRNEMERAKSQVGEARALVAETKELLEGHPDIYYTGYTQDAQKEYAEAECVYAFISQAEIPTPEDIGLETAS
jgi:translin